MTRLGVNRECTSAVCMQGLWQHDQAKLIIIMSINSGSSNKIKWFINVMQINMHDGMADNCFLASLLQGNRGPKRIIVFAKYRNWQMLSRPAVYWSWSWRVEGCGSSSTGSSSSSSPIGWKSEVAQLIPVKALNIASSLISVDGSMSGAKVCLWIGGVRSWDLWIGALTFLLSAS